MLRLSWKSKLFRIMKATFFIILMSIIQVFAINTYSQSSRLSLSLKNVSTKTVLLQIEDKSKFYFIYDASVVDVEKIVNVESDNELINNVLDELFTGTDVVYKINNRQIALTTEPSSNNPQQKSITGKVTDQVGNPLPGVSVVLKGSTNGTVTNALGEYSLANISSNSIVQFSFIGMKTQEVNVSGKTNINIELTEEVVGLEEVIAVGYGTKVKKSLTSSISTVNSSNFTNDVSSDPILRIQGKAAGITIDDSHVPGGNANVYIRGLGTINNSSPLYMIDGVPASNLSMVNSEEIESISILKDATSAAIYGARGANGVIIVTTKRGGNKQKVSVSTRYGVSAYNTPFHMLDTKQMGEMLWLQAKNQGVPPMSAVYGNGVTPVIPDYIVPVGAMEGDPRTNPSLYSYKLDNFYNITRSNKRGTDWYSAIINNGAKLSETNLSLSGGNEKGDYAVNFGYLTQDGILNYTSYDRYTIRANSDTQINKWLKIGESLGVSMSKNKGDFGNGNEWTAMGYANTMWTIFPLKDIQGNWAGTRGTDSNGDNPLALLYRSKDNTTKQISGVGNLYAQVKIFDGLVFKSLAGFNVNYSNGRYIGRKSPEAQEPSLIDKLSQSSSESYQWNFTNTLDYKMIIGNHSLNFLLGTEAISNSYRSFGASRSTFYSDSNDYMELNAGQEDKNNFGYSGANSTASYFARVNYDYKSKYLLELTVRRDGSSRFGLNNQWSNFPAASVGWLISEEGFLSGLKDKGNSLKLRGGYGISGNDQIGDYNSYSTYATNVYASNYALDGSYNSSIPGFFAERIGNINAKWESTSTADVGFDLGLFRSKLNLSVDVWERKTTDMLYAKAIPMVAGASAPPAVNIGDMNNKGFDLSLNYSNKALNGELTYNLGLTLSRYKNKIKAISDNPDEFISGTEFRYQTYTRAQAGTAFPEFYGLIVDGIFQTQAEADAYPQEFGGGYNSPGHFKFRDVNNDGIIDDNDRTFIGSPHPRFTSGFNIDVNYKAFSLNAFFYASCGNKIYDYTRRWIDYGMMGSNFSEDALYKSWGSPYLENNADATLPMVDTNDISQYSSTAFLQDGSYLRMKTLQLSYSLPKKICDRLTMSKLQVYIQGTNLFTITKFKGWDPENVTTGIDKGVQTGQWPTTKMVMLGVKLDM